MHVETCPFEGERIFFENAGGSLRLKSVVETSALYASYPDNQGRENDASKSLVKSIENGKASIRFGAEMFIHQFCGTRSPLKCTCYSHCNSFDCIKGIE